MGEFSYLSILLSNNIQMSMGNSKINEDIVCSNPVICQVDQDGILQTVLSGKQKVPGDIAKNHHSSFSPLFLAKNKTWMQVKLPSSSNQGGRDDWEQWGLSRNPQLVQKRDSLDDLLRKCNKWQSVQVNIITELLRHGMVFVVLTSPPSTAHTATKTIDDNLQPDINGDIA